jgi:diacylglycerol O-acyltransferase / wax synthase
MPVDRLSPLDEAFLRIESDAAHMHVGWTLLVEGEPPPLAVLRRHVASRLDHMPRFRKRVLCSPVRLHDPIWVDDPEFDPSNQIVEARLDPPGGPAEVRALAGRLLSEPLDRERPLWRLSLVTGLRDGGFAVIGQAHHALVDGLAAVEVAQLLLDVVPDTPQAIARRWTPEPQPPLVERALASIAERVKLAQGTASVGVRALANPGVLAEGFGALRRLGSALTPVARPAPATALNDAIGPERSVAFAELPLDAAKEIGRTGGATVNDVVLATSALALGRYLRRAGECHPWLRTLVPVSTRPDGAGAELGNRISFVLAELPVGERSPTAALEEVSRQMRAHKQAANAGALDGLLRAARFAPLAIRDAIGWVATRPQTFNTIVSNVPGPPQPLYLLGRRVHAAYPAVPLPEGRGVSVGLLSYQGTLHVGLYADPEIVPDVLELARDFTSSFDALRFALAPRPPESPDPGRDRPRERQAPASPRQSRDRVLV